MGELCQHEKEGLTAVHWSRQKPDCPWCEIDRLRGMLGKQQPTLCNAAHGLRLRGMTSTASQLEKVIDQQAATKESEGV